MVTSDHVKDAPAKPAEEPYRYTYLMKTWSIEKSPPLQPFTHVDASSRALNYANPRTFLDSANVVEMMPAFRSEVQRLNLAELDGEGKDQLALNVACNGVIVLHNQQDFINWGLKFYTEWGRYFGPLHAHPLAGHPEGYPDIHLVYKDANSHFNTMDSITTTVWHSDCSFKLQPAGITAFWLLSQPKTGRDMLYTTQVLNLQSLSPTMANFLCTLKAMHTAVNSMCSKCSGMVRQEPIETVHPVECHTRLQVRKLYLLLNFFYDHVAMSTDHQVRIKWEPMSVVVWVRGTTAHTATSDYAHLKAHRHGARISAQAERPILALDGLKMDD
ncbi:TauD-domain-containing protein [Mycena albidolilacea]|uniref:TauD-domain-containing protein n=1 Tax=Mycena albidolilacea TaxID=1033008 RepID=A0AAD6ZKK1_9AGAR|nr:TauD-domain-containing protein [Mycena albidolilacea]